MTWQLRFFSQISLLFSAAFVCFAADGRSAVDVLHDPPALTVNSPGPESSAFRLSADARLDIVQLYGAYARAEDDAGGSVDALLACFTDDGGLETSTGLDLHGQPQLRRFFTASKSALQGKIRRHFSTNHVFSVTLVSPMHTIVEVETSFFVFEHGTNAVATGRSRDTVLGANNAWHFQSRRLDFDVPQDGTSPYLQPGLLPKRFDPSQTDTDIQAPPLPKGSSN